MLAIPLMLPAGAVARADTDPVVAAPISSAALVVNRDTAQVAPGVTLTTFDRLDPFGWARAT